MAQYTQYRQPFSWIHDPTVSIEYAKVKFGNSFAQLVVNPQNSNMFDKKLASLWNTGKNGFPGSLAVSVLRSNFDVVKNNKYHTLVKTDGLRYILHVFSNQNGVPIVDMFQRSGRHFIVPLSVNEIVSRGTILDGELVMTKDGRFQYHVFDCVAVGGIFMGDRPYSERLEEAKELVSDGFLFNGKTDIFEIIVKDTITPEQARIYLVLDQDSPEFPLDYPIDGIIMVRENAPYICGKDDKLFSVLKFKTDHTVDFWVQVIKIEGSGYLAELNVTEDNRKIRAASIRITDQDLVKTGVNSPMLFNNCILECGWSPEKHQWTPIKIRTDKQVPNNSLTYNLTIQNIDENIRPKEICECLVLSQN